MKAKCIALGLILSLLSLSACNSETVNSVQDRDTEEVLVNNACNDSIPYKGNDLIINKTNQPEGVIEVRGTLRVEKTNDLQSPAEIITIPLAPHNSPQVLREYFSTEGAYNYVDFPIGEYKKGILISTAYIPKIDQEKILSDLKEKREVTLRLYFNGGDASSKKSAGFTDACRIEFVPPVLENKQKVQSNSSVNNLTAANLPPIPPDLKLNPRSTPVALITPPISQNNRNTFWCRDDLTNSNKALHIDENKRIRGITTAAGFVDVKEVSVLDSFQGVFFHINPVGNNKILASYFATNSYSNSSGEKLSFEKNAHVMLLGSLENNQLTSTAEFSAETARKILQAIQSKKEIPLRLSFYVRSYDFGLPGNFTSACKIEAL